MTSQSIKGAGTPQPTVNLRTPDRTSGSRPATQVMQNTTGLPDQNDQASNDLIGTIVADRYRLLEKLGEGGMGSVYRGEHTSLRNRVAVKFLHRELSDNNELVERFKREAVAAANLSHPNIAEGKDFGQLPDGTFFLVMEFIEGRALRKLLDDEPRMSPTRVWKILRQVGSALSRAHALGIVHRDLKPENIMVCDREGETDIVKIIDFGIARITGSAFGSSGPALTQMGSVFGTPEYMAPEQAMGQPVDATADQYAFGVIAFEMIAGRRPYDADEPVELLHKHVGAPIPKLSEVVPGVTADLESVITKILGKRPYERFESVSAAVSALELAMAPWIGSKPNIVADRSSQVPAMPASPTGNVAAVPVSMTPGQLPASVPVTPVANPGGMGFGPAVTANPVSPPVQPSAPPVGPLVTSPSVTPPERSSQELSDRNRRMGLILGAVGIAVLAVMLALLTSGKKPGSGPNEGQNNRQLDTRPIAVRMQEYQAQTDIAQALALSLQGNYTQAEQVLRARSTRDPQDGLALYYLGTTMYLHGNLPGAVTTLGQALRLEPTLSTDPTVASVYIAALGTPASAIMALDQLRSAPLVQSEVVASQIANEVIGNIHPSVHAGALQLAPLYLDKMRAIPAARVRLRVASNCNELGTLVQELANNPAAEIAQDIRNIRSDNCGMVLSQAMCRCP